jgi:hypothetical protein
MRRNGLSLKLRKVSSWSICYCIKLPNAIRQRPGYQQQNHVTKSTVSGCLDCVLSTAVQKPDLVACPCVPDLASVLWDQTAKILLIIVCIIVCTMLQAEQKLLSFVSESVEQ